MATYKSHFSADKSINNGVRQVLWNLQTIHYVKHYNYKLNCDEWLRETESPILIGDMNLAIYAFNKRVADLKEYVGVYTNEELHTNWADTNEGHQQYGNYKIVVKEGEEWYEVECMEEMIWTEKTDSPIAFTPNGGFDMYGGTMSCLSRLPYDFNDYCHAKKGDDENKPQKEKESPSFLVYDCKENKVVYSK